MCGIAGYIGGSHDEQYLSYSHEFQSSRGPDNRDSNTFELGKYAIGVAHQRLSILDLSDNGDQPITSQSGRITAVFNGEIYNHRHLRAKYDIPIIRSSSDTELLVELIDKIGLQNACREFNGMFSIGVVDRQSQSLSLVRDRLGKKPLHYILQENKLFYASELKTLVCSGRADFVINEGVAMDYLVNSLVGHSVNTFVKDVVQVAPGEILSFDLTADNLACNSSIFWKLKAVEDTAHYSCEKLHDDIFESVKLRLDADVPVGIALSGGIDSSVIAACGTKLVDKDLLNFYSFISPGDESDESAFIYLVAKHLGVKVTTVSNTDISMNDPVGLMEEHCFINDAPIKSFSEVLFRKLMNAASENGTKVMLTGQGADELFCGYRKYAALQIINSFRRGEVAKGVSLFWKNGVRGVVGKDFKFSEAKRYFGYASESSLHKRLQQNYVSQFKRKYEDLRELQIDDVERLSVPYLCHYEDRMSMSASVEVRSPFLDYRLVESAFTMPETSKIRNGWTKHILRKAFELELPKEIIWRKDKKGFTNPQDAWFRGPLSRNVLEVMNSKSCYVYELGIVDQSAYLRMLKSYLNGSNLIWFREVFAPFSLEMWLVSMFKGMRS